MIRLPADFRDFLKLLNSRHVEYLLIGGYAVCFHGFYRNTADIDFWVAISPDNARKLVVLIKEFGFETPELSEAFVFEERTHHPYGRGTYTD